MLQRDSKAPTEEKYPLDAPDSALHTPHFILFWRKPEAVFARDLQYWLFPTGKLYKIPEKRRSRCWKPQTQSCSEIASVK